MHPYIAVPAVGALVLRAWSSESLSPAGIAIATITAIIHVIHPWSVFFALLVVFYIGGTRVTKMKHEVKARLTHSSTGQSGGEGPRTYVQVLANSGVASVLVLLHYFHLSGWERYRGSGPYGADLLVIGIVCNYAAVAADTFSSELGILSKSKPRLITSWFREVPPGTNGGVTLAGFLAGFLGAFTIAATSILLLPFHRTGSATFTYRVLGVKQAGRLGGEQWGWREVLLWVVAISVWGVLGSVLDSILGAWLQASVVDSRTGKVIEGDGGGKVLVQAPHSMKDDKANTRRVVSGLGILDNNAVNFLMAFTMSVGGMAVASYVWDVPLRSILL